MQTITIDQWIEVRTTGLQNCWRQRSLDGWFHLQKNSFNSHKCLIPSTKPMMTTTNRENHQDKIVGYTLR